jgi:hypothetical protein
LEDHERLSNLHRYFLDLDMRFFFLKHRTSSACSIDCFDLKIGKWGPQSMVLGDIPNKQPNGYLGIWIQVTGEQRIGEVEVLFDGKPFHGTVKTKLITTGIPPEELTQPGKKEIVIKQVLTGKTFPVGTFVIDSMQELAMTRYHNFMYNVLGTTVPCDLQHVKLHSIYSEDSEWFQRCYNALLCIEHDYAQELINQIKRSNVPGSFVEFGVFRGDWIKLLMDMTQRAGLNDRDVWGFDSFKGLSTPHPIHDGSFWKEGMYAASRSEVEKYLDTANHSRVKLVEGFFRDSLKGQEAAALGDVAYARIDCDLYEPATECLAFLSQRLSHGAVLVFDDWNHDIEYGEGKAFAEWIPKVTHLKFEFIFLGPWDHLYLRVWHRVSDIKADNLGLGVINWGPRSMILDDIPNKQPDGSLGLWIEVTCEQRMGDVHILFNGMPQPTTVHGSLLTTGVPPEELTQPGKKEIVIKQVLTGRTFPVGTFVISL